jgi:predicted HicB family RNase H-like nuclease
MKESRRQPNVSIRIDKDALHEAKVAAVTAKKTLGKWLGEAIQEKIEREVIKGRKP